MRKKNNEIKLDVLIVGAGFGGMYMLHKLRELGLEALIVEAGDGVEGHGIGIDILGLDVMLKVLNILILSQKNYNKNGVGQVDIPHKVKFLSMQIMLRTDSI